MNWSSDDGVDVSMSISVGFEESVNLSADIAGQSGHLTLGQVAQIRLRPVHLETIRDQLPGVLAAAGVLEAADDRAAGAGSRADELERYLRHHADTADAAGEPERAGELRRVADRLKTAVGDLDAALSGLERAAQAADGASEVAKKLLDAQIAKDQPAGEQSDREPAERGDAQ